MTGEKNMENLKIGKKISEYRRVHNLTIKEFSELTNLSSALLSQLERGMGNPSLSALQSIASALNVSLSSLFEEDVTNESLILRREDRKTIYNPDQKHVLYDVLTPSPLNSSVELLLMKLKQKKNLFCLLMKSIALTNRSRTVFCRMWRTERLFWLAQLLRIRRLS